MDEPIILDPESLSKFFGDIAADFDATPVEMILTALAVIAFIAFFVVGYVLTSKRARRQRRQRAQELFERKVECRGLSAEERQALLDLADTVPRGREKLPRMVRSARTFERAATHRREAGVSEDTILALRVKLGFYEQSKQGPVHSTAEIPPGTAVHLRIHGLGGYHGRVVDQQPDVLLVEMDEDVEPFRKGTTVEASLKRPSGLYSFDTRVTDYRGYVVFLEHTGTVRKTQKRNYFRKKLRRAVTVRKLSNGSRVVRSTLLDIGGGGASFERAGIDVEVGDDVQLIMYLEEDLVISVQARVVRLSRNGEVGHVAFHDLRPGEQDRIVRYVLRS
jgi:c-di-GMP-binding flagellar brake protein YcgR